MKSKIVVFVMVVILAVACVGCTEQERAKSFGGSMTVELEPDVKLIEITWKDDDLWYLTRPMQEDEVAETYIFKERSSLGLFEGEVVISETKTDN